MLIILIAMSITQVAYFVIALFALEITKTGQDESLNEVNQESNVEERWHDEAKHIQNFTDETITQHFESWKQRYPKAAMFWISEDGTLRSKVNVQEQLPSTWTPSFTTKFIKERYGGNPFTVIAFVGEDETNGFIVLEIPRDVFNPPLRNIYEQYGSLVFLGVIVIVLFFLFAYPFCSLEGFENAY